MTDMPNNLNAALARLQMELPRIEKDQTAKVETRSGGSYQYTYADLAQVSQKVLPVLGKLGLAFTSRPTTREGGRLVLVYELRHVSGEMIEGEYPLPDRGSPQEIGGAITYARRYCLCAVTGVAPEGDDNEAALAEQAATRRRRSSRSEQPQQPSGSGGQEPPITGEQKARMQRAFGELGIAEQGDRLKYAIGVVGRQVKSATELTQFEAGRVIKQAERDVEKRQRANRNGGEDWPEAAKPADADGGVSA